MRIITGSARGRRLLTLECEDVRPSTERVKEALFIFLQFEIVLDLFAGSGQLGLEALSRGAREAVFVDAGKEPISIVEKNLANTGLGEHAKVLHMDYAAFLLRRNDPFDIAFLDPPYRTGLLQKALPMTAAIMNKGGVIVCEHPVDEEVPDTAGDFERKRDYRYGKILLTVYRHRDL
mgnify:FL=1